MGSARSDRRTILRSWHLESVMGVVRDEWSQVGSDLISPQGARHPAARDAPPLIEDGDAAVEALVDLDGGLGIVALMRRGQELDLLASEADGVIIVYGALVLKAKDGLRVEPGGPGPIGRGWVHRPPGEAGIVA